MNYDLALRVATEALYYISPVIERGVIAGSVRRGKPEVHDIEIVCVPKMGKASDGGLFDGLDFPDEQAARVSLLTDEYLAPLGKMLKSGPRMKQIHLSEYDINLELYIVLPPAEYGVILAIRTGSKDFSNWLVTKRMQGGALPSNLRVKEGAVWRGTEKLCTPEEDDFFKLCGLPTPEPSKREPPATWKKTQLPY